MSCSCASQSAPLSPDLSVGGPFDFLSPAVEGVRNAAYNVLQNDPTEAVFCAMRNSLPAPIRNALVSSSSEPFSVMERAGNFTAGTLVPLQAGLMFPPALPFAGMLSVPLTLFLEAGRFLRRIVAECGVINALIGEARDTLTMLDFWTPNHPVGGPARTALALAGGSAANMFVDRLRAPLTAVLKPLTERRVPRVQDILRAVSQVFGLAMQASGDPAIAEGEDLANRALAFWCEHPALTGEHCGPPTRPTRTPASGPRPTLTPIGGRNEPSRPPKTKGQSALPKLALGVGVALVVKSVL